MQRKRDRRQVIGWGKMREKERKRAVRLEERGDGERYVERNRQEG